MDLETVQPFRDILPIAGVYSLRSGLPSTLNYRYMVLCGLTQLVLRKVRKATVAFMTHIQNSVLRLFKKTDISVKENNIVSFDV